MGLDLKAVDTLQSALTFHRERHTVLASNVANLDTPGYRAVDLERKPASDPAAAGAALAVTDPGHIGAAPGSDFVTRFDDGGALPSPDGNAMSMERELSKIDANRARYATSTELVSRRIAILRYAAGDGV